MVRTLLIASFALLIALPGLQMRYQFVPEEPLSGVRGEPEPGKPRFTFSAWWEGEFQKQAEAWFDEHIGFRGHAVRTDNQIGLSVFHEAFSKAVDTPVVGRRMMIYEDGYIEAYNGQDPFDDDRLRKRARHLRLLQDGLTRRGIAFVLLIAPSKAAIYPEYLPPGLVHPDGQRPPTAYERMLPMLRREGVRLVDGHAILEEEKTQSPHALFPPGGVHWNRYAAHLVLRQAWQALAEQLGRPLVDLRLRSLSEDDTPREADQETDAADLLNAWRVGHADWRFPRPELSPEDGVGAFRPKLVVVGDSFWVLPGFILADHGLTSRNDFYYYFNRVGSWDYVFSADAIIVEVSETMMGHAGYGFAELANEQLSATPPD